MEVWDWYVTRSSKRSVDSADTEPEDGGRGVYLICTLRFDFHMGRLEWVTCQVSVSHGIVGSAKLAGVTASEKVGGRMVMLAIV